MLNHSRTPSFTQRRSPLASPNSILLASAAVLSCALLLVGCTATPQAERVENIPLPQKNVDQWVMPLDQFMRLPAANSDYAENILVEPCMEEAGYEWSIPAHDINANEGASWNGAGIRLLNPALAAQWGYRLAPANDSSIVPLQNFNKQHLGISQAEKQKLDDCTQRVRKTLPILSGSSQIAVVYFGATWEAAKKHRRVISTTKKWRKCMAPLGIADLSADPEDMPSPSLVDKFQIRLETSPIPPVVSSEEIQIATTDLACQDSSGYRLAFYDAQWNEQVKALDSNADALARARKENLDHNKAVLKVIAAHVPNG